MTDIDSILLITFNMKSLNLSQQCNSKNPHTSQELPS